MNFARRVAIVHQYNTASDDITVERLVSFGRTPHLGVMGAKGEDDEKFIEWAMEVTNVAQFRERELSRLSGGQRQRVWIAMALAQGTETLFLDEAYHLSGYPLSDRDPGVGKETEPGIWQDYHHGTS